MKLLSINIRHGGGQRVERLCHWIIGNRPDVIVLTEWRNNRSGASLLNQLHGSGFCYRTSDNSSPATNSICVAARLPITASRLITPTNTLTGQLMMVDFDVRPRILACYFPQGRFKAPFFDHCISYAIENQSEPFVLIGDLNTGRNDLDIEGTGTPFHCAAHFSALSEKAKLIDLWRHRHGIRQEWTWRSQKNGFRIDHAFGNEAFLHQFPSFLCEIDHDPRELGITDHSAVLLQT